MTLIVLRTFIGFLVQIVPCAVLCVLPFTRHLVPSPRRVYGTAAVAILLAEIPFCLATVIPFGEDAVAIRFLVQDLVFIALVGVFIALYFSRVDTPPLSQKLFVALLALNLGFFATIMNENVGVLLELPGVVSYRYPPELLISLIVINVALLVPMVPLMRKLGQLFETLPDAHVWARMCVLPGCFFAIMFVFHQLPLESVPTWTLYCIQSTAIMVFAIFMFWWIIGVARTAGEAAGTRERLSAALEQATQSHESLAQQLVGAEARVAQLERALEAQANIRSAEAPDSQHDGIPARSIDDSWENETVALVGSRQAASFLAGDVLYVESSNRARILHLADGSKITIDTTLAQIYAELPAGHFAYCHRSVVVNLHRVAAVNAGELVLDDGTRHPMSRRRYLDFRAAMEAARNVE